MMRQKVAETQRERSKKKKRTKTQEGRSREDERETDQPSCLLIKQPRGEAISPPVKAELRWVTQGTDPTQSTAACGASGQSQSKDTWINSERRGSTPAKPTGLRRPSGVTFPLQPGVETEGLRLKAWLLS